MTQHNGSNRNRNSNRGQSSNGSNKRGQREEYIIDREERYHDDEARGFDVVLDEQYHTREESGRYEDDDNDDDGDGDGDTPPAPPRPEPRDSNRPEPRHTEREASRKGSNRPEPRKGKGKGKTVCQVNRQQFRQTARSFTLPVQGDNVRMGAKEFSTGSFGWYGNGKIEMLVDGVPVLCQVGFTLTVIGSKEAD